VNLYCVVRATCSHVTRRENPRHTAEGGPHLLRSKGVRDPCGDRGHDGIIPRPTSVYKGKGGGSGRFSDWPPETVEQAAVIYVLRHSAGWIKPTNKAIIEIRKEVEAFYEMIDELNRTGDANVFF